MLINQSLLGSEVLQKYRWMIANLRNKDQIKSVVFLPLLRSERIIGALMLLSHDINRYQQGIGTLFLQKLSAMITIVVENCLNQQRLKEVSYQVVLAQAYNRRYFDCVSKIRLPDASVGMMTVLVCF